MSEILDIANEMARDLFKVSAMDEITMRKIDALRLLLERNNRHINTIDVDFRS